MHAVTLWYHEVMVVIIMGIVVYSDGEVDTCLLVVLYTCTYRKPKNESPSTTFK